MGSWIISLLRSPKLLDDGRAECIADKESQVKALESEREDLRNQLAGPKISPPQHDRRSHVADVLKNYSIEEIALLEYLTRRGKTDVTMLREQFPNTLPLNNMLVAGLVEHNYPLSGARVNDTSLGCDLASCTVHRRNEVEVKIGFRKRFITSNSFR